jgi:hypothetical protein
MLDEQVTAADALLIGSTRSGGQFRGGKEKSDNENSKGKEKTGAEAGDSSSASTAMPKSSNETGVTTVVDENDIEFYGDEPESGNQNSSPLSEPPSEHQSTVRPVIDGGRRNEKVRKALPETVSNRKESNKEKSVAKPKGSSQIPRAVPRKPSQAKTTSTITPQTLVSIDPRIQVLDVSRALRREGQTLKQLQSQPTTAVSKDQINRQQEKIGRLERQRGEAM